MGFFHASGGRGRLASSLGSKLFPGSLSSSGFVINLLNLSHLFNLCGKPTLIFLRTKITGSKASCLCFNFKSFYVKFSFFLRDFFFLGFLNCSISSRDIVRRASPIGFEVFISSPFIMKVLLKWEINGIFTCDCLH